MKIRNFIFAFLIIFSFPINSTFADCKYTSQISKCDAALKSFTGKDNLKYIWVWWSLRDFKDFPCIQDSDEARIFQIATHENFKSIDKELDQYLKDLFESKSYYFWKQRQGTYFEGIEHIFLKKDEFKKRYTEACTKSYEETGECTKNSAYAEKASQQAVSILWAINFISWNRWPWSCYLLAKVKTDIFLEIAYNWLLLNRQQVTRDQQKEYIQNQRENFWDVLEAMRVNQAYIERLNKKWTSKTKHTLNSR